jgi:ABC-2 type transport system permease protein
VTTTAVYDLCDVVRMEWYKSRTVRSTACLLLLFAAAMIGLAVAVGVVEPLHPDYSYDPTETLFAGLGLGQLLISIFGVLTLSSEFSSGSIQATFAAVPHRGRVLAAKAVVVAAVSLAAGEVLAFTAFAAFHLAVRAGAPDPSLSQPGVLRAVLLAGAYPALVGLIGLGLAGVIRNPVGAIAAITGLLLVLPLLLLPLGEDNPAMKFLPEVIAQNSLTAVKPVTDSLSAGAGFGLLCLYAVAALAAGGWALARRDA